MPTPEEVARRLIDERRNGRQQQWREFVRPVERAVALFVASLWPGIGEAHVRDQEREVQREPSGKTAPAASTGGSTSVAAQTEAAAAAEQGEGSGNATADGL
ncbi:hypothetical protein LTR27_002884 [Elasticomyces elasticus]|nr:hypothetical protein LTR27_002884 [Elasticomyces elasticus]